MWRWPVHPDPTARRVRRSGVAIVIALALLALSAALLVGAAAAARATARAVRSTSGALVAEGEARRALLQWRRAWEVASALPVGATLALSAERGRGGSGMPWTSRLTVQRIGDERWLAVADCAAGPDSAVLARRRYVLVIERAPADSSGAPGAPRPLRHWGIADVH